MQTFWRGGGRRGMGRFATGEALFVQPARCANTAIWYDRPPRPQTFNWPTIWLAAWPPGWNDERCAVADRQPSPPAIYTHTHTPGTTQCVYQCSLTNTPMGNITATRNNYQASRWLCWWQRDEGRGPCPPLVGAKWVLNLVFVFIMSFEAYTTIF